MRVEQKLRADREWGIGELGSSAGARMTTAGGGRGPRGRKQKAWRLGDVGMKLVWAGDV